jgi:hypothetical protein
MLSEEQYMERTPGLIAEIRKLREAAEKEMNKFTRVADYDVCRVIGQKPKTPQVSEGTPLPFPAGERPKKPVAVLMTQTSIEFSPAPAERSDHGEDA